MINNIQMWCYTTMEYNKAMEMQAVYDLARETNPETPHVMVIDCRTWTF